MELGGICVQPSLSLLTIHAGTVGEPALSAELLCMTFKGCQCVTCAVSWRVTGARRRFPLILEVQGWVTSWEIHVQQLSTLTPAVQQMGRTCLHFQLEDNSF